MITENTCSRETVLAICATWSRWAVDDKGEPTYCMLADDADLNNVEYVCEVCEQFFNTCGDALAHLKEAA